MLNFFMNIYLKISQVTFQYLLYLSNIITLHAVLPLNNCSALRLLASITGMPSLFVFET